MNTLEVCFVISVGEEKNNEKEINPGP